MILVTGATGFVGRHLVRRLIEEGHEVRCLVRPSSKKSAYLKELNVEVLPGDVTDAGEVKSAVTGCDSVYSLVGLLHEAADYTFEAVHHGGVSNIVNACTVSGVKRLIHVSALGVSPDAGSRYHRTKLAAEEVITESGLEYTIFRPSVIFGEDDSFINLFAPLIRRFPFFGIIGDGNYRMQPVYIEDLVACMFKALDDTEAIGEIYEIGGGEALAFRDIVDCIASAAGRRVLKFPIPVFAARQIAKVMELMPRPLLTSDQLIMLLEDNVCDNRKAAEKFGVEFLSFSEGVKSILSK